MTSEPRPPRPARRGPERFLDQAGRIQAMPRKADDRRALLSLIVERVLSPGESIDEKELGRRLAPFGSDPATLRRYLVDAGYLVRTSAGTAYRLPDH